MTRICCTLLLAGMLPLLCWRCSGGANDKAPDPNPSGSRFQVPRQIDPLAPAQKVQPVAVPAPTTSTPVPTPAPVAAAGLNPAHGQPGHRCDIPVGAPLNSPPGNQPTVTTQKNAQPIITPVVNNTPPTAPGMNPPHGQPGHRCDIAVGAPLNSPPAAIPAKQQEPAKVVPAPVPIQAAPTNTSDTAKGQ